MRSFYVDTSWLVAVEFGEPGARDMVGALRADDRLLTSTLLEAEWLAACARERVTAASTLLPRFTWVHPDRRLSSELDRVFGAGLVKGAHAWHLACALFLDPSASELSVVTLDEKQAGVARKLGFNVPPARGRR